MSAAKVFRKDEKKLIELFKMRGYAYILCYGLEVASLFISSVSEEKLFVLYFDYTKKDPKSAAATIL